MSLTTHWSKFDPFELGNPIQVPSSIKTFSGQQHVQGYAKKGILTFHFPNAHGANQVSALNDKFIGKVGRADVRVHASGDTVFVRMPEAVVAEHFTNG